MRTRQRGVATIEFVIAAPLLCLLLLGIVEIGRVLHQYNTLTKSVQDGVRHGAEEGILAGLGFVVLTPELVADIRNLVVYGNVQGTGEANLPGWGTESITVQRVDDDHLRVVADYTYAPVFGSQLPTFGLADAPIRFGFTMSCAVTMRAL